MDSRRPSGASLPDKIRRLCRDAPLGRLARPRRALLLHLRKGSVVVGTLVLGAAIACTPPVRQFDLKQQALTCEQANDYTLRTLQAMRFTITTLEPAAIGRPGRLRGTRKEQGTQNVTVVVTCSGKGVDVDASEDGKFLGQLEFKRGFYLSFTAVVSQAAVLEAAAREAALRPPQERKEKGLRVLVEPVRGLAAKLDFDLDLAAAGVLPVRITISNATSRTYRFDPADVVLMQTDGARVRPLSVEDAAQRVADAAAQPAPPTPSGRDRGAITQRLQQRVLSGASVSANQTAKGYLFYPLAPYVKARVSLEDQASEETEGFVVEF